MALKSCIMPSPTTSSFSAWAESPSSPTAFRTIPNPKRLSGSTSNGLEPPQSPYPQHVDPSPVGSNGTEITDIDDEDDHATSKDLTVNSPRIVSPGSASSESMLGKLDTELALRTRADSDGGLQSVIYAPRDFKHFNSQTDSPQDSQKSRSTAVSPSEKSTATTVISPLSPPSQETSTSTPIDAGTPTFPLNTNVAPAKAMPTPRAQTMQEVEEERRRRSRHSTSLEDIPEGQDQDRQDIFEPEKSDEEPKLERKASESEKVESLSLRRSSSVEEKRQQTVNALKEGLSQCWTLCNTLAGLSSNHRHRIFNYRGKSEVQEQAWKSCWKLCQKLYDTRDEDHQSHILDTLNLCRDFCQALFEARQKADEAADSVLRVSFELNNHLYNAHDRELPKAFQERTLDFYLTLSHRLMRQRTSLPEETDSLLRACWSLAEMLFSLRQNNRDGKPADEEMLGSAVQACWELCDLFREGWTQVRPDKTTPRPSQTSFGEKGLRSQNSFSELNSPALSRASSQRSRSEHYSHLKSTLPPETPTTIFDDSNDHEDPMDDANTPNILVLGTDHSNSQSRLPSGASSYSESSQRTSSTATISGNSNNLARIRILLVRAAINAGFSPRSPSGSISSMHSGSEQLLQHHQLQNNQSLLTFVKSMPSDAFGSSAWQINLLDKYRRMVLGWSDIVRTGGTGNNTSPQLLIQAEKKRVTAAEIARAVQWIIGRDQYSWLRDLYLWVFKFSPHDATDMATIHVQA